MQATVQVRQVAEAASLDWSECARCRGMDVERFFRRDSEGVASAKAICWRCPVRLECLAEALREPDVRGVWGGTSERERRAMRRAAV
jgi:WhiB family redox-sensing transcriptional regulator